MEKIVKNGMRTTGRFALNGSECKVVFSAPYRCFEVKNEGMADIVVSIEKGKAATDSGVIIVAPQTSATLAHMRPNVSTVYITGEGNIQVVGKNEVEAVFKLGGTGGGDVTINGVSQTYVDSRDSAVLKAAKDYADEAAEKINAKNAIACDNKPTYADGVITYTKDGVAYSTDETDTWFYYNDGEELKQTIFVEGEEFTITSAGKVDFTEFVSSSDVTSTYTGNEGDTSKIPDIAALRMLDGKITGNISNPNLLINSDLRINQRGKNGTVTEAGYFVDRWQLVNGTVTINSDGTLTLNGTIKQMLENAVGSATTSSASAGTASYDDSTKTFTLTAAGETIAWAKLELGSIATPFVPPDPATELTKCQRYYCSESRLQVIDLVSYHTHFALVNVRFPVKMRTIPSVKILSIQDTENAISHWATMLDAYTNITCNTGDLSNEGFGSIYCDNELYVENDTDWKYAFKYTADAEIY